MFTTYRVTRLRPDGQARGKRPLNALLAIVGSRLQRVLNRAGTEQPGSQKTKVGNCRADPARCA